MFHVRNAQPGDMAALLATLDAYPDLRTIADIVEQAEELGFIVRDRQRLEALATARDLGLMQEKDNVLTEAGESLAQLELNKPDVFPNIVHGLYYTLWDKQQPGVNCFSWSYRTLCQMLWRGEILSVNDRGEVASQIESMASSVFGRSDIAFSPKSVGGILVWLEELDPPVLDDEMRFTPRSFCPPELFVAAVGFVYVEQGVDYGSNLLLTDDRQDSISQVCLLDSTSFDRVLEYSVAQFDYLARGIGGGWGRYLTLDRRPTMKDFVS